MSAYDKLKATRQSDRPTASSYINGILDNTLELHGDRRFADDAAITAGIGEINNIPVTYIGIEKGRDIQDRIKHNFGCPKPEGYRKALRLMKQAEKFKRPVICFVDTQGAFCGADAEERGQGQAIAENLMEMMGLNTPVITVVIGEGGSGGALALACANRVYMLENSVYSVISPESCATILWKDAGKVADAAECLHITATDMVELGVAEKIINEDFAHFDLMCKQLKTELVNDINELFTIPTNELSIDRYNRFRKLGHYVEH